MNTYVVWGWKLPIFAWNEGRIYLNCGDSPRTGEEISVHPFKLQNIYSVCSTVKEACEVCLAQGVM